MKRKFIPLMLFRSAVMMLLFSAVSCENLDDDIDKHAPQPDSVNVSLDGVAKILSAIPLQQSHLVEVYQAVTSSSRNGYDEEYTMRDLFDSPGRGVGDAPGSKSSATVSSENSLRDLIEEHVRSQAATKAAPGDGYDPDAYLSALTDSDIQIYWPFSQEWDGETMPVVTFDPEDGSETNIGYWLRVKDDGVYVEEVVVDEALASEVPVWVVNRNSDAGYTSLEMLRREDPNWGEGGGTIIVNPATRAKAYCKSLILKNFTMKRHYDTWFAGASEFFVKAGFVDDFTAATEAELQMYNPKVTDFMVVVKRNQLGVPQNVDAMLISDWNEQMTHCAFMIIEDDGGKRTDWKCTALVRIESKSYGVELNMPFSSRDDIVWRGQLAHSWIDAHSNISGRFGDIDLTFEVVEY